MNPNSRSVVGVVSGSEGVLAWGTGVRSAMVEGGRASSEGGRASSGATLAGVSVLSVVGLAMSKRGSSSEEDMVTSQPEACGIMKELV